MDKLKRKLVAILAADAVGYSRKMGDDEEGTLRVLSAHRAVIDGIIDFHDGRIFGTAGDSVLAEFVSPVEAVRCAVEIQDALRTRNDSLPEARRLQFRIGVNLGDVMEKGDDLLGDGVNVAARLEGIAETGGISISSSVYDQIAGKLDLGFVEVGEQKLKNIERPIRVYRVSMGGTPLPAVAKTDALAPKTGVPKIWLAVGGGAMLLVAAIAAWQMRAQTAKPADPSSAQSSPAAGTPATPADRSAELKAQTEIEIAKARAEAQAKADAEIAKVRADAELAKVRAETEALRRQAATSATAAKSAEAKAVADAAAAKARAEEQAKAQAEIAKARDDAEALRRRGPESPAAARALQTEAKASAAAAGASTWFAQRNCEGFRDLPALKDSLPVQVRADEFVVERGAPGSQGHFSAQGKRAADGSMALVGVFTSRQGSQGPVEFQGRFDGERYEAKGRMGMRPCTITITRGAN
jgi:class 3 adenylate cyclase